MSILCAIEKVTVFLCLSSPICHSHLISAYLIVASLVQISVHVTSAVPGTQERLNPSFCYPKSYLQEEVQWVGARVPAANVVRRYSEGVGWAVTLGEEGPGLVIGSEPQKLGQSVGRGYRGPGARGYQL